MAEGLLALLWVISQAPVSSAAATEGCDFTDAVARDDVSAARTLVKKGCRPPRPSSLDGPLDRAVMKSQKVMTRLLLEAGADPNVPGLLVRLSQGGDTAAVKLLLDHGARVNEPDAEGRTPLRAAVSGFEATGAAGCDRDSGATPRAPCWRGYPEMVRLLLSRGAEPNLRNGSGVAAVHSAIASGGIDSAWLLLHDRGADLSIADNNGWTPLHLAARQASLRLVTFLLSKGVSPNLADADGATPLHVTTDLSVARALIAKGASVGAQDATGATPLHNAAASVERGEARPGMGKLLVLARAPIDLADHKGRTPLHEAALVGNGELVELLLKKGADARAKDHDGLTPLHLMGLWSRPWAPLNESWRRTVKSLVKAGARFTDVDLAGRTPLWLAIVGGRTEMVDLFLWAGAQATELGPRRGSVLHLAAALDSRWVITRLLKSGAALDALDAERRTPLQWAAVYGRPQVAALLLARGALPNGADASGRTALDWATIGCQQPTAEVLHRAGALHGVGKLTTCEVPPAHAFDPALERAAQAPQTNELKVLCGGQVDVELRDRKGRTPLHLVAQHGYLKGELRSLLDRGADPNAKDDEGLTPLHVAAADGNEPFARQLIAAGADVHAVDAHGRTPLHLVPFRYQVFELTMLLIDKGASLRATDRLGRTPLHSLSDTSPEQRALAELFVCSGADPTASDLLGWTAADLAAMGGWPDASTARCGTAWEDHQRAGREASALPRTWY